MRNPAVFLVAFVALQHAAFLVLEMFLWTKPAGMRVFNLTPEFAAQSRVLAANQGLYNGFLSAGLVYGLVTHSPEIVLLFLAFVVIAGVFGAATVSGRVLLIQAFPAIAAAVMVSRH